MENVWPVMFVLGIFSVVVAVLEGMRDDIRDDDDETRRLNRQYNEEENR